jgi:hypothetical protein
MADSTINGLSAGAAVSATDEVPAWQASTVKITAAQIKTFTSASPTLVTPTISGLATITQGTANAGIIASTGYSLTGSNATPMIDLAGTLNTTGVVPVIRVNITNTASGTASSFLDFLLSGVTQYTFQKNGYLTATGAFQINSSLAADDTGLTTKAAGKIRWSSTASYAGTADTFIVRSAAATIQQGDANAASPVAQTLQAQGSRSGTDSNVAGANYTIRSGAGTGNATPSSLILQSYVAVASGTGAQTATTCLTLTKGGGTVGVGGLIFPTADPLIAGAWWDNAGTLTKSAG